MYKYEIFVADSGTCVNIFIFSNAKYAVLITSLTLVQLIPRTETRNILRSWIMLMIQMTILKSWVKSANKDQLFFPLQFKKKISSQWILVHGKAT